MIRNGFSYCAYPLCAVNLPTGFRIASQSGRREKIPARQLFFSLDFFQRTPIDVVDGLFPPADAIDVWVQDPPSVSALGRSV